MTISLLFNNLIVEPELSPETATGGLHLPGTQARQPQTYGRVTHVGPGVSRFNLGDMVFWAPGAAVPITIEFGKAPVQLLTEEDIIGILTPETPSAV